MNFNATCPHCQNAITAPANVEVVCPYCQGKVVVSAPAAQPAAVPQLGCVGTLAVMLIGSVVWAMISKPTPAQTPSHYHTLDAPRTSGLSNEELQRIIADVYKVETSRFIQNDLLWITLPSSLNAQKTCQAIANLWASRSGLDYVRVECWSGDQRVGQGTVHFGQIRTP